MSSNYVQLMVERAAWYLQQLCEIGEEFLGEFQSRKKATFPQTLSGKSN